jgi:toluene monooxygenase system ferredoxin subunit
MSFCKVGTLDDVWRGEKVAVEVSGRRLLLVNVNGAVCAFEDRCRHQGVRLSEGRLEGSVLTCAAHGWQYDVRTGHGVNPEGSRLTCYEVKIENDDILVDLPEGDGGEPRA